MAVTDRLGQIILGIVMLVVGAGTALGHFFVEQPHPPQKWEILLAAGALFMAGWLLDPRGTAARIEVIRNSLPFLEDTHKHTPDHTHDHDHGDET